MKAILMILLLISTSVLAEKSLTSQIKERKEKGKSMPAHIKMEFSKALKQLKDSGIESKAINKGTKVPDFKIDGKDFKEFYSSKPVILKFYRGSWCPYCQLEMKAYESYKSKIENKGYKIIVLTPDNKKEIKKFKMKQSVSIDIFQDKNNSIAKKFGIAFKLSDKIAELYKGFGIDLKNNQDNDFNELPLPGTYIINKKGIITYGFIDSDYTKRLDPIDLLKML